MKIESLSEYAFYIDNFLSTEECDEYIRLSESLGYGIAAINNAGIQQVVTEIRNNDRVIYDSYELAEIIWRKIKDYLPDNFDGFSIKGLNERFRFYRYDTKQVFRWHRDGSYRRNNEESKLSLIIYLNEDFVGGETGFRQFKITPKTGRVTVFKHELLHEGSLLKSGRKYVMRTDVMYEKI